MPQHIQDLGPISEEILIFVIRIRKRIPNFPLTKMSSQGGDVQVRRSPEEDVFNFKGIKERVLKVQNRGLALMKLKLKQNMEIR